MELLSPAPDLTFRRSFVRLAVTSAVVHGIILTWIITYSMKNQRYLLKGPIYTVNLVEVPAGVKSATRGLAPPVRKSMVAPLPKRLKAPAERNLKLPSKAKLKQPTPIKKPVRAKAPAPEPKAAPKKTVVAAAPAGGASLSVDAASFPFTYYLRAVERKISANWDPVVHGLPEGDKKTVVIAFRILRDGSVQKPIVEKSSGMSYLDQSALRAVVRSTPMPPLPETFPDDSLGIHFGFHYKPEG